MSICLIKWKLKLITEASWVSEGLTNIICEEKVRGVKDDRKTITVMFNEL